MNGSVPTLTGKDAAIFRQSVERWSKFAVKSAKEYGIPWSWVLGMIFAESKGNPTAVSPAGAIGLTQLHSSAAKDGHANEEIMASPELQIDLGAKYLSKCHKRDFVIALSAYNAGGPHPDPSSPWGMRSEKGYVDRAVAANNFAVDRWLQGGQAPEGAKPPNATVDGWGMAGAALALAAAAAYWRKL